MARYLVTSDSHFEPFSYDDIVKPLQQMTDIHNATMDEYDKLSMETSALGRYISENPEDSQAKAIYDGYNKLLDDMTTSLNQDGLSNNTRRQLSTARKMYTQDIGRLSAAITNRQERHKEYAEMMRNHPEMAMGIDPGSAGLNAYLSDDNYGSNWYSYSTKALFDEVANDVEARGREFLRTLSISSDPKIRGYITKRQGKAFTNKETSNAGAAVVTALAGDNSLYKNLSDPERILADVVISHLQTSGALQALQEERLAPQQFNRLVNASIQGLSKGVGDIAEKDYTDLAYQAGLKASSGKKGGTGGDTTYGTGYLPGRPIVRVKRSDANKTEKVLGKEFGNKSNQPYAIQTPDGRVISSNEHSEITNAVYHNAAREDFKNETGFDVALPAYTWYRSKTKGHQRGRTASGVELVTDALSDKDAARLGLLKGAVAVKTIINGKPVLNDSYTIAYNEAKRQYDEYLSQTKALNQNADISEVALTPEESKKLRKDYSVPDSVSDGDLYVAISRKASDYRIAAPQLVGSDVHYDDARVRYANEISAHYYRAKNAAKNGKAKNIGKTSRAAFYKVGENGLDYSSEGTTELKDVFVLNEAGNIVPSSILSITMLPSDVNTTAGTSEGDSKFRILTTKGEWVVSSEMLGDDIDSRLNSDKFLQTYNLLMTPIVDPYSTFSATDEVSEKFGDLASRILGDRMPQVEYVDYKNGKETLIQAPASAKEILRNEQLYNEYLQAISDILQIKLSNILDVVSLNSRQVPGKTSKDATPYITYIPQGE